MTVGIGDVYSVGSGGMVADSDDGGGATVYAPAIGLVNPAVSAPAGGGTGIITGQHFGATAGSVSIDGTGCTIVSWSASEVRFTYPALAAGARTLTLTDASAYTDTYAVTYRSDSVALDRYGIASVVAEMLRADTTTLYGESKLVQTIETDPTKFEAARVDNRKPFKMYLWTSSESTPSVRARNTDDEYSIGIRIEGYLSNVETIATRIDDIWEQVKHLVNQQMWQGNMLVGYYTASSAQVINIEPLNSELPPPEQSDNGTLVVECEGGILVQVNRWV